MRMLPRLLCFGWLGALALSGSAWAQNDAETDPLKRLVQTLSTGSPAPAQDWIEVLVEQPTNTTSDLWHILKEEGNAPAVRAYEQTLFAISARLAEQHQGQPFSGPEWRPRIRISIEILQSLGTSTQMQHTLDLLQLGFHGPEDIPRAYRLSFETRALQDALAGALGRDAEGWEVLYQHYDQADFQVARAMLRALGDSSLPPTANALGRWLGQRPPLDAVLLTQIARVLRNPAITLHEAHRESVRRLIHKGHASIRQAAIRVLGFADDVDSIQPLIQVLQDPNLALHEESLRALHRITAMTIDGHPDRWRVWYQEETLWWRQSAPTTLAAIGVSHPTRIAELLRELGSKRLFRREIAPKLLPLLRDRRSEVVRMALAALDSLRPPLALVEDSIGPLIDHRHHLVREDAERVLQHLGGDPDHWKHKLQRPREASTPLFPQPQ